MSKVPVTLTNPQSSTPVTSKVTTEGTGSVDPSSATPRVMLASYTPLSSYPLPSQSPTIPLAESTVPAKVPLTDTSAIAPPSPYVSPSTNIYSPASTEHENSSEPKAPALNNEKSGVVSSWAHIIYHVPV